MWQKYIVFIWTKTFKRIFDLTNMWNLIYGAKNEEN